MRILRSGKEIEVTNEQFLSRIEGYDKLIIDLGTGQGAFVYFNALSNRNYFYVGLDSCGDSMKKYSVKQYKNKVNNLIYIIMNVQYIEDILKYRFLEIYINLPWGSLLEGIFNEDLNVIKSISELGKKGCKISICFSYGEKFERNEIERRKLPVLNDLYFNQKFKPMYEKYNLTINNIDCISRDNLTLKSKWRYVLSSSNRDRMFYLISGEKRQVQ